MSLQCGLTFRVTLCQLWSFVSWWKQGVGGQGLIPTASHHFKNKKDNKIFQYFLCVLWVKTYSWAWKKTTCFERPHFMLKEGMIFQSSVGSTVHWMWYGALKNHMADPGCKGTNCSVHTNLHKADPVFPKMMAKLERWPLARRRTNAFTGTVVKA